MLPDVVQLRLSGWIASVGAVALASLGAGAAFGRSERADVVMVYLLGIVLVSLRFGYGPSLLATVLSVLAFNFLFVPPYYTLLVADLHHITTFAVMFLVAVVISGLTQRVRTQAEQRAKLAAETEDARVLVEAERLRSALLSSVSHDLRTPLAVITGSASTLVQDGERLDEPTRRDLAQTIFEEADRLNRLIRNLLDMTRLESGTVKIKKEWQPLEEVVGAALDRSESKLEAHRVDVRLPPDLPLVPLDGVLLEQLLINLLENAAKYTSPSEPIEILATAGEHEVVVEVADRGPGIPAGDEKRIFEKFQRAAREGETGGFGLGLAICRAIIAAHGGRLWVENRKGGGASFKFSIPIAGEAPTVT
ncbi:MAG: hypothetical protein JWM74_960 [Myxococcaceae bacterium]|nr:hypothetical protein [Myxococcaceae bacterium]